MEDYQDTTGKYPPGKYLGYVNMLQVEDAGRVVVCQIEELRKKTIEARNERQ